MCELVQDLIVYNSSLYMLFDLLHNLENRQQQILSSLEVKERGHKWLVEDESSVGVI